MKPALDMTIWHQGPQTRLTCRGHIDSSSAPKVEDAINLVLETQPAVLLVDWRHVEKPLTALAAEVLLDCVRACSDLNVELRVVLDPTASVSDVLASQLRGHLVQPIEPAEPSRYCHGARATSEMGRTAVLKCRR